MTLPLEKRWEIYPPIPPDIDQALTSYHPLLRQLLYNRGIQDADSAKAYLEISGSLYDPFLLSGMNIATDRILKAIDEHEQIAIYGDYDVDGVTATALLVKVLRKLGAEVNEYIPNRFEEGYGMNKDALDTLYANGVRLVITVDSGIRSPIEAQYARSIGLDLIISDHHEPKNDLPPCLAVICPKQVGDLYPEKNLAGVGVAFKIADALLRKRPVDGIKSEDWLDLVAIGTVADIVPLLGENRTLVKAGLDLLRRGQRPGLYSLARIAGLNIQTISARDIGFCLGPRLNAAGRLDTALLAYNLLIAEDLASAGMLAQKLDDQNKQRQTMTMQIQHDAEVLVDQYPDDYLLYAAHTEFSMGLIGLVASRLTETHYRPSIIASIDAKGEFTRASCRSIPEFHITHALDECSDLLVRHGGHAMAAGFTVLTENLTKLVDRMREIAHRDLAGRELRPVLTADKEISLRDYRGEELRAIYENIQRLEPSGMENPGALFVSYNLPVDGYKAVGAEKKHLKLKVKDGPVTFDAIAFRQGHWEKHKLEKIGLLYSLEVNEYNSNTSYQLNVRDLKLS